MTWLRLIRGELRKLTTTKLPWGFLAVLVIIAGIDAAVVMFGTDMDGSKGFIATAADQQSLMAFAFNAMIGTGLFGAIAVAREYGHNTVVPTFLTSPRRPRAVLAQLTAVLLGGGVLGLVGQALIIVGVALALPSTEYGFMVSAGNVIQLLAASTFAGAIGAVLGAGLGAVIRNLGGAVTAVVLGLFMIPPLVVQLVNDAASWIPPTLGAVISGVNTDVNLWAALAVLLAWGLVPALSASWPSSVVTSSSEAPARQLLAWRGRGPAEPLGRARAVKDVERVNASPGGSGVRGSVSRRLNRWLTSRAPGPSAAG